MTRATRVFQVEDTAIAKVGLAVEAEVDVVVGGAIEMELSATTVAAKSDCADGELGGEKLTEELRGSIGGCSIGEEAMRLLKSKALLLMFLEGLSSPGRRCGGRRRCGVGGRDRRVRGLGVSTWLVWRRRGGRLSKVDGISRW